MRGEEDQALFERSGAFHTTDLLVSFLYDLMRDHLPAGTVESLVRGAGKPNTTITMTNGYLAAYARDQARRLQQYVPEDKSAVDADALLEQLASTRGLIEMDIRCGKKPPSALSDWDSSPLGELFAEMSV